MQAYLNIKQKLLKVWIGMKLLSLAAPKQFISLLYLKLIESLMVPLATWLLAKLIKSILANSLSFHPFMIGGLGLIIFAEQILHPITEREKRTLSAKLKAYIDKLVMDKITDVDDVHSLEQKHLQEQIIKFKDNDYFTMLWLNILSQTFTGILKITFSLLLLTPIFSYKIIILPIVLFFKLLQQVKINNATFEGREEIIALRKKLEYSTKIILKTEFAPEIKVFNLIPFFKNIYKKNAYLLQKILLKDYKKLTLNQLCWGILEALIIISLFIHLLLFTTTSSQELFIAFTALTQINIGINSLFALLAIGPREANYLIDLVNFLNINNHPIQGITIVTPHKKNQFKLSDLRFCYQSDNFSLDIEDLSLPEKAIVAFVGKNGSGKSTLLKLLCKLYHPQAGHIYLNQIDLADYNSQELWKNYSAVFQDFVHYKTTLKENILLGDLDKINDIAVIHKAISLSQFELKNFKNGLNTELGLEFGGQELSGGEWQKLALARSFMKLEKANMFLFDEASANLDAEAEFILLQTLKALRDNDKTIFLVTHRLTTAAKADYIVVLDKGKIIEHGTHVQLLAQKDMYANLYNMQDKLIK